MTTLILIRHAHAHYNPDPMRPLSADGLREADALVARLAGQPIARIYSSPHRRAVQTVQPLADHLGLPIELVDDLREREFGTVEDSAFLDFVERSWRDFAVAQPDGESNTQAQHRVAAAIAAVLSGASNGPSGPIAIAGHGNALSLYLNSLDSTIGFDFWRALQMPDAYRVTLGNLPLRCERL